MQKMPSDFCTIPEFYKYDMNHKRRGKAIIFNLYSESEGGPIDVQNLSDALGNYYKFEVEVHSENTYKEIYDILSTVIMLAHGTNAGICASDQTFKTSELWTPFTNCATLVGKPKLFLIQACRGKLKDLGVQVDSSASCVMLPRMADILIIYSSFEEYVSYITSSGTPFIKQLCDELVKEENADLEFCRIITFAINTIARNYKFCVDGTEITKQIPTYTSSLTKALYFKPKRY